MQDWAKPQIKTVKEPRTQTDHTKNMAQETTTYEAKKNS
jgi:hypothetical protein